ncbi:structural protein P5 [Bacteroides neonati]|uniref:structural protein P5 n=1 Tax=Bacteroides neonati TaxID=1347393 RepID=UPI0004B32EEC|nr:structural protein P5 [Bacteroides neonati]
MRGLRNNNPGNIRKSKTEWQGEIIPSTDSAFKQFKSMAYGYRAMIKLLQNYSRLNNCRTIRTMISRWAPPSENDTQSYIATVRTLTGMGADHVVDINDKETMCRLAAAMSQVENGKRAVMADVEAGWELL